MADLDPKVFPEAVEYLEGLGGDLGAHPDCQTSTEFFLDINSSFPDLIDHPSLSPRLREAFHLPWDGQDWMPSVLVVTLLTMVRDEVHRSDDAFLDWNFRRQLRIYQKPVFRALMFLLSPTLLFIGAARRWKNFHRGSELKLTGDKKRADLRLVFPEGLYSRAFQVSLVAAFRAALQASKALDPEVELLSTGKTESRYQARWG